MAYRKGYSKRRYQKRRRRRRPARGGGYLGTASRALAVAYGVKRLLNVEKKYIDSTPGSGGVSVSSSGTVTLLNGCAQGDTDQTRDGNQMKMTSMSLRGYVTNHPSAANTSVRMMILIKKSNDGAAPVPNLVLDSLSPNSLYNRDHIHRYKVLSDKRYVLNSAARTNIQFTLNIPMDEKVRYDGTTASVADIDKSGLYILLISDQSTNTPIFYYNARVNYVDN